MRWRDQQSSRAHHKPNTRCTSPRSPGPSPTPPPPQAPKDQNAPRRSSSASVPPPIPQLHLPPCPCPVPQRPRGFRRRVRRRKSVAGTTTVNACPSSQLLRVLTKRRSTPRRASAFHTEAFLCFRESRINRHAACRSKQGSSKRWETSLTTSIGITATEEVLAEWRQPHSTFPSAPLLSAGPSPPRPEKR